MDTEYDFIKFLIFSNGIDEVLDGLKDFSSDYSELQLSNGKVVKLQAIIRNIDNWRKSGKTHFAIMDELIIRYCPMLEYYM